MTKVRRRLGVAGGLPELQRRLADLAERLEGIHLAEYAELFKRPGRLLLLNFLSGVARGLGAAVGFAVVSAALLYILQSALVRNLPLVGGFVAEIVRHVQFNLNVVR